MRLLWLALALAVALGGCESASPTPAPPPPPGPARLGTVTVMSATVSVNGRPVQGTVSLNDGDKVATDATGRAHIELAGHETVDLEPNTDPWFIREGACVLVRILFGGALVSGSRLCVEDDQGTRVTLKSAIYVHVAPRRTTVTVVEGTVELRGASESTPTILTRFQRISIMNGRLQNRVIVPPIQVHGIRLRFPAPPKPPPPPPPPPPILRVPIPGR